MGEEGADDTDGATAGGGSSATATATADVATADVGSRSTWSSFLLFLCRPLFLLPCDDDTGGSSACCDERGAGVGASVAGVGGDAPPSADNAADDAASDGAGESEGEREEGEGDGEGEAADGCSGGGELPMISSGGMNAPARAARAALRALRRLFLSSSSASRSANTSASSTWTVLGAASVASLLSSSSFSLAIAAAATSDMSLRFFLAHSDTADEDTLGDALALPVGSHSSTPTLLVRLAFLGSKAGVMKVLLQSS
mmetsp:Transcript_37197/g.93389  ORF Transcript_37197/g.93389 Transcript_37197/m.93389 type:complete len:257 (+) Transcript_37197:118-888(+)